MAGVEDNAQSMETGSSSSSFRKGMLSITEGIDHVCTDDASSLDAKKMDETACAPTTEHDLGLQKKLLRGKQKIERDDNVVRGAASCNIIASTHHEPINVPVTLTPDARAQHGTSTRNSPMKRFARRSLKKAFQIVARQAYEKVAEILCVEERNIKIKTSIYFYIKPPHNANQLLLRGKRAKDTDITSEVTAA